MLQLGIHGTGRLPVNKITGRSGSAGSKLAVAKLELQLLGRRSAIRGSQATDKADGHRIATEKHEGIDTDPAWYARSPNARFEVRTNSTLVRRC